MSQLLSNCCKAPMIVSGIHTHYYICSKCNKDCDPYYREKTTTLKEETKKWLSMMPKEFGDKYLHEIIWDLGDWLMDMPPYVVDLALDKENE